MSDLKINAGPLYVNRRHKDDHIEITIVDDDYTYAELYMEGEEGEQMANLFAASIELYAVANASLPIFKKLMELFEVKKSVGMSINDVGIQQLDTLINETEKALKKARGE